MSSDRTEKATPKRREDARRKGQLARRPELSAALSFVAVLLTLRATGEPIEQRALALFKSMVLRATDDKPLVVPVVQGMLAEAVFNLALLTLPIIAAALVVGVVGNFAQGGLTFTPNALAPKGERFNPASNLKRVFGGNNFVELLKSILKLGFIGAVCYGLLAREVANAPSLIGVPAAQTLNAFGSLVYQLTLRAGFAFLALAAADYGYGWFKHEKSLRMTKQEQKDEYRQQEGDPMVKGQRRRQARALINRRIAQEVPRATVVVTNPTHFAVALRYDREHDAAPIVVAKDADQMAKRIREIARANNITVMENPPLARALYRAVEPGRVIPAELFRAVAELLAYVYGKAGKSEAL